MSYNLLAPIYVRPVDKRTGKIQEFASVSMAYGRRRFGRGKRQRKLRQQIQDSQADIVCLQEVQFVKNEKSEKQWELPMYLQMKDFGSVLPCDKDLDVMAKRNLRVLNKHAPVANAILFRHDRFEMVSEISTRNQRLSATFRHLSAKGEKLFVASLHLDATDPYKRSSTLRKCMQDFQKSKCKGAVFAGDMNSEFGPGTPCSAMCRDAIKPSLKVFREECFQREEGTEKDLDKYVKEWERNRKDSKLSRCLIERVPTKETRCGFDHGKVVGPCVAWKLDHILFSGRGVELKHVWESLESDAKALKTGLPNEDNPSDHIPVAAVFEWKQQEEKGEKKCEKEMEMMERMSALHEKERKQMESEIASLEPSILREYEKELGQSKKRQRPPDEIVKFYRLRRSKQAS